MTNEEKLREIFPKTIFIYRKESDKTTAIQCSDEWLNAEYKEPKTGHWIGIDEEPHEVWECDHCGFVIDGSGCIDPYDYRDTYKFCPNCGAKMVEPQESEDTETWNGIHAQITAPKGTFERIFNDADDDNDI